MARKCLQIFFLQAPRSLRVKHGKFTQGQPQCNIPEVFWSRHSSISICPLSFRHLMLAVAVTRKSIHVLTAGGNVCPNEQQHKGLCWCVHRRLLQESGTWFHNELQLLLFMGNSSCSCNCSHSYLSPGNQDRGGLASCCCQSSVTFIPVVFLCNSRSVLLCAAVSYGQQFTLCCFYRFWHVLQWVLFFPCFRHRPNPPGVLGNGAWAQLLEDTHLHPVQRESGVRKIWLWCCDEVQELASQRSSQVVLLPELQDEPVQQGM